MEALYVRTYGFTKGGEVLNISTSYVLVGSETHKEMLIQQEETKDIDRFEFTEPKTLEEILNG